MWTPVDPRAAEPVFEQIAFRAKEAIAQGLLRAGERLPSVRELAKELAVNPNTVARAYGALESDGVIVRRQGQGCFVSERPGGVAAAERRRRLAGLIARLVTEAFHLGVDERALLAALERRLAARAGKR